MSFRRAFRHQGLIERQVRTPDDGGGHTVTWTSIATVPCWAWWDGSSLNIEGGKLTTVDERKAAVLIGTDVIVGDRITVRNQIGRVVYPTMTVDAIGMTPEYLVLIARDIG